MIQRVKQAEHIKGIMLKKLIFRATLLLWVIYKGHLQNMTYF